MHYSFFIFLTFVGCCTNVYFLEVLTSTVPGSGNLITLAQFLFISVKGFIMEQKFGTKKSVIPISKYLSLVLMFFVVSVLNNYALNFNISMPLHMIFRSGSLIANMLLGIIIMKKTYSIREYISIVMISVGIFICTLASANDKTKKTETEASGATNEQGFSEIFWWIIGIVMLTLALVLSACMGLVQEKLYKKHGKHPDEALYYNHVLTLPMFLFLYKDIGNQILTFNQSEPSDILWISLPIFWVYLIGNTLTQYVCIKSVFVLTTECTSLTVTLVLTLRKFTSLMISIIYFKNPFTQAHWFGTLLVFIGTIMFTNVIKKLIDGLQSANTQKKNE